ncbi:hypothetical protein CCP3SC1_590015 [Gammaproteobacteria bacterium]
MVAVDQHIVGSKRIATLTMTLNASLCDWIVASNPAAINDAPTCRSKLRVNMLGSGFVFCCCSIHFLK